jgi:hypothetical protein
VAGIGGGAASMQLPALAASSPKPALPAVNVASVGQGSRLLASLKAINADSIASSRCWVATLRVDSTIEPPIDIIPAVMAAMIEMTMASSRRVKPVGLNQPLRWRRLGGLHMDEMFCICLHSVGILQ